MISDLDEHVGAVLQRLEDRGLSQNTIVIFTSDNGPTHGGGDQRFHIGGAGCTFFNSTGGLKGFKGSCYEGGIRVPCIVKWPGHVAAGATSELPSYFPDWFPTLCGIVGADLPAQRLDGIDLQPELTGESTPQRGEPMIWEFHGYGGIVAIRDGIWKAVRRKLQSGQPMDWELYNLEVDPNESKNLATRHPEIVHRLESTFVADRCVEPDFPCPVYDPRTN